MSVMATTEVWKAAVMAAAFATIYAISRWGARLSDAVPPVPERGTKSMAIKPLDESNSKWHKVVPIDARLQFARTEVVDEQDLLPIRILNMYFARFDIVPGPLDPTSFADEIFVDLYDEKEGHKWTSSYFVTTPRGLEQMLEDEHWQYAFADQTFFVRRYDAKLIRQMIVEHLVSTLEMPGPLKDTEDTYL